MGADFVTNSGSHCVAPLAAGAREGRRSAEHNTIGRMLVAEEARELVKNFSLGGRKVRRNAGQKHEKRGAWIETVALGQKALGGGGESDEAVALV